MLCCLDVSAISCKRASCYVNGLTSEIAFSKTELNHASEPAANLSLISSNIFVARTKERNRSVVCPRWYVPLCVDGDYDCFQKVLVRKACFQTSIRGLEEG